MKDGRFKKGQIPWNKGTAKSRTCTECKKVFTYRLAGNNKRFCSQICYRLFNRGSKHPSWVKNVESYGAKHQYINRRFGKANKCENRLCVYPRKNSCRVWILKPKRFEWAKLRKSEYTRKRKDYAMLCPSCHRSYDLNLIDIKL